MFVRIANADETDQEGGRHHEEGTAQNESSASEFLDQEPCDHDTDDGKTVLDNCEIEGHAGGKAGLLQEVHDV